jgi:hypothetical protein
MFATATRIIPHDEVPDMPSYEKFQTRIRRIVGWDVGRVNDPTSICVIEHQHVGTTTWHEHARPGQPPRRVQQHEELFWLRYLVTHPLGMTYPNQLAKVVELMSQPELQGCPLVIDAGGVGAQSVQYARQSGLHNVVGITITGGRVSSHQTEGDFTNSKQSLILNLDAEMQRGRFKIAEGIGQEAIELVRELTMFRRHYTGANGIFGFEAAPGATDDRVMAVSLSLWLATRPPPPVAQFGSWGQV